MRRAERKIRNKRKLNCSRQERNRNLEEGYRAKKRRERKRRGEA